jgi:RimJ/RimL family protein N-acetyltransferase
MQLIALPEDSDAQAINYRWPAGIDERLGQEVIALYNDAIRTETILGYTQSLSAQEGRRIVGRIDESVRAGDKYFFGIHHGERLIGMALLTPNVLPNCRHIVEWSKGIIHSRYRGRSVLKRAIFAMAQRCREMRWDVVTLDVRADTRAHRLWSALGFREYGRLADYARVNGVAQAGAFLFANTDDLLRDLSPAGATTRGRDNGQP